MNILQNSLVLFFSLNTLHFFYKANKGQFAGLAKNIQDWLTFCTLRQCFGGKIYRFSYCISHLWVGFLPFISLKVFLNRIFKLDANGNCDFLCLHPSPTFLCKFNSSLTHKFQQSLCLYMFLLNSRVIYLVIFIKIFSLRCH